MVSLPGVLFATVIAVRSVHRLALQTPKLGSPSTGSPTLLTVNVCPAWAVPESIVPADMTAASANPAASILTRPRAEISLLNWISLYYLRV